MTEVLFSLAVPDATTEMQPTHRNQPYTSASSDAGVACQRRLCQWSQEIGNQCLGFQCGSSSTPACWPPRSFPLCSAQTSASSHDAFRGKNLKELEKMVSSIFKHLYRHPAMRIDLQFGCEITDEPLLSSLSVGKSRWLSLLAPLLFGSWKSTLAHLHFHFSCLADHESQKTIQWCFLGLCTWKAKVVMAGVLDVLTIANACKNRLETDLTSDRRGFGVAEAKAPGILPKVVHCSRGSLWESGHCSWQHSFWENFAQSTTSKAL